MATLRAWIGWMTVGTVVATGVTVAASRPAHADLAPPAPPHSTTWFTPVVPARLLDTRPGQATIDGRGLPSTPIAGDATFDLPVLGRGGVPATGVSAVVLNVTATSATAPTFVTVFPTGSARPEASNLNVRPTQTVPNLVVAKVGAAGMVSIYNRAGALDVIADVAGYFPDTDGFVPIEPARLLETRPGLATFDGQGRPGARLGVGSTIDVAVVGRGGIPASGVDAVVLNVTAIDPDAASFITVWPAGSARPVASNLNTAPGQTRPNLVVAKVGSGGNVSIYNQVGTVDVAVDAAGYFPTSGTFVSLQPARILETRPGLPVTDGGLQKGGWIGDAQTIDVPVLGIGGVPATGVSAVVLNVTAIFPTSPSYVTVWPTGVAQPNASNLNLAGGRQVLPNLVVARVGAGGKVSVYHHQGLTDMVIDVAGYFVDEPSTVRDLVTNEDTTCALDRLGRATCWGQADWAEGFVYGRPNGTIAGPAPMGAPFQLRTFSDVVDIAVGAITACVLRVDGSVWCWNMGGNPPLASDPPLIGDGSRGYAWPAVRVPNLTDVVDLEAGPQSTCALRADGTVWCWGVLAHVTRSLPEPISGITDAEQIAVGTNSACAVRATGAVVCWGNLASTGLLGDGTATDSPSTPVTVSGLTDADLVSVHGLVACATRTNGGAVCWGNSFLGAGTTGPSLTPVPVTESISGLPVTDIVEIDGGADYRCVLRTDQQVYCWGGSSQAMRGLAPTPLTTRITTAVAGLPAVRSIEGSYQHTCAVTLDDDIYCWGWNADGQIGDGTFVDRPTPTLVDWVV